METPALRRSILIAATVLLTAPVASAHDFWLEPSSFSPEVGSRVQVAIRVGEHFRGDPVPRNDAKIRRFVLLDGRGETALVGAPGSDPAGATTVGSAGTAIAGYVGNPTPITLDSKTFEAYLREEGLEHVVESRAKAGRSQAAAREIYSRCAKAILRVGGSAGAGFERVLGCEFELLPEVIPSTPVDGVATFRTVFDGGPAAGVKVVALKHGTATRVEARTGTDGRATFTLGAPGVWLVKAVHMRAAPESSGADWRSIWASVTFEVAGSEPPAAHSAFAAPVAVRRRVLCGFPAEASGRPPLSLAAGSQREP